MSKEEHRLVVRTLQQMELRSSGAIARMGAKSQLGTPVKSGKITRGKSGKTNAMRKSKRKSEAQATGI